MMKAGDRVRVYPHGSPEQAAIATVVIISENQRAIGVGFEDRPPFVIIRDAMAILPGYGLALFANRFAIDGQPWGPWVELFGEGHFEIEEMEQT